jgi:hypothetical protein
MFGAGELNEATHIGSLAEQERLTELPEAEHGLPRTG